MKLEPSIKIKFFLFCLTFSFAIQASPVALINSVKGGAFVVHHGKTKSLKRGHIVQANSEIMLEEGAQLSLTDYFDHEIHLSSSSHLKMGKKSLELKRGSAWIQSYNKKNPHFIKTANSVIGFIYGEGIVSFNPHKGRTHLLSMEGSFTVSNVMNLKLRTQVDAGHFSFIDANFNKGTPRRPTKIGNESYGSLVGKYENIEKMSGNDFVFPKSTQILAAQVAPVKVKKPGTITFISSAKKKKRSRSIASVPSKRKKMKKSPQKLQKSNVQVRIFGAIAESKPSVTQVQKVSIPAPVKQQVLAPTVVTRAPASVRPSSPSSYSAFKKSFTKQYEAQKKHPESVNSLINELQSYKVDYRKDY